MPPDHDILNPDSPWRIDVRRNAAARDQMLIDEAEATYGATGSMLANVRAAAAIDRLNEWNHRLHAEREAKERES